MKQLRELATWSKGHLLRADPCYKLLGDIRTPLPGEQRGPAHTQEQSARPSDPGVLSWRPSVNLGLTVRAPGCAHKFLPWEGQAFRVSRCSLGSHNDRHRLVTQE